MFPLNDEGYYCADMESHYVETWAAMEKLVDEGLTRSIGLSNFNKSVNDPDPATILPQNLPLTLNVNPTPAHHPDDYPDLNNSKFISSEAMGTLSVKDIIQYD